MHETTPKRLGVVGTLVWDTIRYRDGQPEQVEALGRGGVRLIGFRGRSPGQLGNRTERQSGVRPVGVGMELSAILSEDRHGDGDSGRP